jgi:hypothetical protein
MIELSREQRTVRDKVKKFLRAKYVESCLDLNLKNIFMSDKIGMYVHYANSIQVHPAHAPLPWVL